MRETGDVIPNARTWREIPQQVKSRAMSRKGRARFLLASVKTGGALIAMAMAGWSAYEIFTTLQSEPKKIANAVNSAPVKEIAVTTDGVLDRDWVGRTLSLSSNAVLVELDLQRLQLKLLESGQVRSAVLTKTFPSTLSVTLSERAPVAHLMAQLGDEPAIEYLVARDGVVFAGHGHDDEMRRTLPWLTGVSLVKQGRGFAPIGNMEAVSSLLAKARNEAPQLYATWRIVDLSRLASDGEIIVQSAEIEKIVFSTAMDFFAQIARLDYVRDAMRPMPHTVNLGLGAHVVAAYAESTGVNVPALSARGVARPNPRQFLPVLSNP